MSPTAVRLGYLPLNDAAALIVARELGLFDAEGLEVELVREASWATVRDKLAAGALDGSHILAPLALAMAAGVGREPTPLIAPFTLNLGGAAITVQSRLTALAEDGGLADLVRRRQAQGASRLTFASVFPFSIHEYCLRSWLEAAGLQPDTDVRLTVVPPSRAADLLAEGVIEGFCAGEPWNTLAVSRGAGRIVARVEDVLPTAADKVLALRADSAAASGSSPLSLVRALDKASAWIATAENLAALSDILARPAALDLDAGTIREGIRGIVFHGQGANRPNPSHASWYEVQMRRWKQRTGMSGPADATTPLFRPDLYDQAFAISNA